MNRVALAQILAIVVVGPGCTPAALPATPRPPAAADADLLAAIEKIPAIDDHAHPVRILGAGERDDDWDQLSYDGIEPFRVGARLEDDVTWIAAAKALYSYPFADLTPDRFKWIGDARARLLQVHGDSYPAWVLDQLGIETELANRSALGRGLAPPRFRWVPYDDALLYPLDNGGMRATSPDRAAFFPGITRGARAALEGAGLDRLPPTLDAYLGQVVIPTLERQKRDGAVAIKFESAYLRSLRFGDPAEADARRVYEKYAGGGVPADGDYRTLQDLLMRRIAREAGRLGLPVHVHCAFGPGRWFQDSETGPFALESLIDDPKLADTRFVIVHGGWPAVHETTVLLAKKNVWADFSWQPLVGYARPLSRTLREWLEFMPDKVLFGTDAFPLAGSHWELPLWVATTTARTALAMALTDMMNDGEIDRGKALELARMVLHDNAATLYGLRPAR
jgi:predicted TIM-barrel fold metal-dependent hydrolase